MRRLFVVASLALLIPAGMAQIGNPATNRNR